MPHLSPPHGDATGLVIYLLIRESQINTSQTNTNFTFFSNDNQGFSFDAPIPGYEVAVTMLKMVIQIYSLLSS